MSSHSTIPPDYETRLYAGVLGKIIGVYLGRPFEQWPFERIQSTFGEVEYYVHEQVGVPLIVADDDITGTFTFVRALEDHGAAPGLTAEQIGATWLNYIIENRTILWWGGLGYAAEHTAFLRLKNGIPAPASGSIELNGWQVAEEIGSQIFIEGWAFVAPGNPQLAADLARKAASVSHDREAIYGAQVIAVLVSQAFVESDLNALLDLALTFIPDECEVARCIRDVRAWHAADPNDWRATRLKIVEKYGYERYGTNCPLVSNHAIVMLGLLYGEDDFSRSLQITCNAAYDTDCNAANVGAILGVKNGLSGIDNSEYDWRGPVADRLFLPTAEGGSCFCDALTVSTVLANQGRRLAGLEPQFPKNGARFHFSQPGSVQGFTSSSNALELSNVERGGTRQLQLHAISSSDVAEATTDTLLLPSNNNGYGLIGNPSLFAGQTVSSHVEAAPANSSPLEVALVLYCLDAQGELVAHLGETTRVPGGQKAVLEWKIPDFDGQPIGKVGLRLMNAHAGDRLWLDCYNWDGEPDVCFEARRTAGSTWKAAWVNSVDSQIDWEKEFHVIIQNRGRGLVSTGTCEWKSYRADARFKLRAAQGGGVAVRYGGLERYYGLMLRAGGKLVLFKRRDGVETVLAETNLAWEYEPLYDLFLSADGPNLTAGVGEKVLLHATDENAPFLRGGIALLIEEGCLMAERVAVAPLDRTVA